MNDASLYRRILPSPPAIKFASAEGKQLFIEALRNGTMEGFFELISYFQTQSEPSYCGLTSLSMVLNALSIDPERKWKGPWRWFDESMLDCCEPLEKVKTEGIAFGKVACLAHCYGAEVKSYGTNQSSLDDFRDHIVSCTSSKDCHLIAAYHRKTFNQTGSGHFSPIGGYHTSRDMVLILDVARFKYPPHWVPLALLWEAMNTIDETTGDYRGFMLISNFQGAQSVFFTLNCNHENWVSTAKYLVEELPILLKSESLHKIADVLTLIFDYLPTNTENFIKWKTEIDRKEEDRGNSFMREEENSRYATKEMLLQQVHETELFNFVRNWPCCSTAQYCCQSGSLSGGFRNKETVSSSYTDGKIDLSLPSSPQEPLLSSDLKNYRSSASRNCFGMRDNAMTILLLTLPSDIWMGVRDKKLQAQFIDLVSNEKLPSILRDEVLHLRQQLGFLVSCKGKELDDLRLM